MIRAARECDVECVGGRAISEQPAMHQRNINDQLVVNRLRALVIANALVLDGVGGDGMFLSDSTDLPSNLF